MCQQLAALSSSYNTDWNLGPGDHSSKAGSLLVPGFLPLPFPKDDYLYYWQWGLGGAVPMPVHM